MEVWKHFLLSSLLAILLYPVFGWKALLVLTGGVLIDVDHYLYYVAKFRKFNPANCYYFFEVEIVKNGYREVIGGLLIFHTIEFLLIMTILSFYSQLALLFTIGMLGHYILDFIMFYFLLKRFILSHSIVWWLLKNKQKV